MWMCSRVGKRNSLATLRQLRIYGTRYKIEKIQKLCENFEKACWRSVRIAEERVFLQKYHFLKHCLKVINNYRKGGSDYTTPVKSDQKSNTLSQSILDMYDGSNSKECLDYATSMLEYSEALKDKDSKPDGTREELMSKLNIKNVDHESIDSSDIDKIKNIIDTLRMNVNLTGKNGENKHSNNIGVNSTNDAGTDVSDSGVNSAKNDSTVKKTNNAPENLCESGKNQDLVGYTRAELEKMIKL